MRRWLLRPAILLIAVGAVSAYIAGPVAWSWLPDLTHRPEYRLKAEEIHFTEAPPWVPPSFLRNVIREGGLSEELSLLDDGLVGHVAAAFQKDPWVERRLGPQGVHAGSCRRLEYRKPVAFVATDTEHYPVDKNAILLPPPNLPPGSEELPVLATHIQLPKDRPAPPGKTG